MVSDGVRKGLWMLLGVGLFIVLLGSFRLVDAFTLFAEAPDLYCVLPNGSLSAECLNASTMTINSSSVKQSNENLDLTVLPFDPVVTNTTLVSGNFTKDIR